MARSTTKRGRKPSQNQTAALLVAALDFLSVVPDKKDDPNAVVINGAFISVNNGLLKASINVDKDFPADAVAKVQMKALMGALNRVGKEMSIAFSDDLVSIEAGEFTAELPNLPIHIDTDRVVPDPNIAPLNNEFRDALNKVAWLVSDSGDELLVSSIAVLGPSVMATKRHTIVEAWHGNDMPYQMIFLPKAFATALAKVKTDIVGFGFSPTTFTVHFSNGAYLQTNTYENAWNIEGKEPGYVFTACANLLADAEGTMINDPGVLSVYMQAIAAVTPADVWVSLGKIESVDGAARFDAKELMVEFGTNPQRYLSVVDYIATAKVLNDAPSRLLFWGDKVRGAMIIDKVRKQPAPSADDVGFAPPPAWAPPPSVAPAPGWGAPPANPTPSPATATAPAPFAVPAGAPLVSGEPLPPTASLSNWGAPTTVDPTSPGFVGQVTAPTSAPAAMPASSSPISGSGPTAQPIAFPSSSGPALFGDDD